MLSLGTWSCRISTSLDVSPVVEVVAAGALPKSPDILGYEEGGRACEVVEKVGFCGCDELGELRKKFARAFVLVVPPGCRSRGKGVK
jgi:hypothetical protein